MEPEFGARVETIGAITFGRYLVRPAASAAAQPAPVLVGFHGYAENAERHLNEISQIDGIGDWLVVSVQALHRFYDRRTGEVVASWMTSQNRERMITDNLLYAASIIDTIHRRYETASTIVYCGFSQGVAMAYRAATRLPPVPSGIIALAGDVPPELRDDPSIRWPKTLIGRGTYDDSYSETQMKADISFLKTAGSDVESVVFDGGHKWSAPFRETAARFLRAVRA